MNENKIFEILNSKWFLIILGIVMILLLPTTYGNLQVVLNADSIGKLWHVPLVFVINVITVIMIFFKVTAKFTEKKQSQTW
jgi:hypothetical protein